MWATQGFQLVVLSAGGPKKRRSAMMNQMVSSSFRYVSGKGYLFSRHTANGRSRDMNFLLFSTEV